MTLNGRSLLVTANNSSLNQILREIARQTGMKITGGLSDDRVFGTYGPASPASVLASLLDGTGSNVLIVQDASHTPTQLILSRRAGGVTPPNPNSSGFDDQDNPPAVAAQPNQPSVPQTPQARIDPRAANRTGVDVNPAATAPSATSQQLVFPPVDASTPPSTATTTPTAPDAAGAEKAKTPQQIFEQLQRLRQQQTTQPNPQ